MSDIDSASYNKGWERGQAAARAEIERLRAENAELLGTARLIRDLEADVERLQEQLKMADELQQQWAVGIERLRAALRWVAEQGDNPDADLDHIVERASAALKVKP